MSDAKNAPKPKDYRPTSRRRGRKALNTLQRELVVQAYALSGNKAEVARQLGINYNTVYNILRQAESDTNLQEVRANALQGIAGKVHTKTEEILDSIVPHDMESGQIKEYNKNGELVGVRLYGPSLMQKVTSAAILTDKLRVLEETKRAILQDEKTDPANMPLPSDIQSAIKSIGDRVRRLRIIDVHLADKHPDLAERLQDAASRVARNPNVEDAEYEDLAAAIDFDNP